MSASLNTEQQRIDAILNNTPGVITVQDNPKETLIKATPPGFFASEAATPKFASS